MYKEIIKTINQQVNDISKQINQLQNDQKIKVEAMKAIEKLQAEYEKENGNLAIQKGVCPFPDSCSIATVCTKNSCNADTCSNGYAYRMS